MCPGTGVSSICHVAPKTNLFPKERVPHPKTNLGLVISRWLTFFEVYFEIVHQLSVVDTNDEADHLEHDEHVEVVRLDVLRFFLGTAFFFAFDRCLIRAGGLRSSPRDVRHRERAWTISTNSFIEQLVEIDPA